MLRPRDARASPLAQHSGDGSASLINIPARVGGWEGVLHLTYFIQIENVCGGVRGRYRLCRNSRFNWKFSKSAKIFSGFNFFPSSARNKGSWFIMRLSTTLISFVD